LQITYNFDELTNKKILSKHTMKISNEPWIHKWIIHPKHPDVVNLAGFLDDLQILYLIKFHSTYGGPNDK